MWLLLLPFAQAVPFFQDDDGDGWGVPEDCDDQDASIYPTAVELCDAIDQDCDGDLDDVAPGLGQVFFNDADDDGYGDPSTALETCLPPSGYVDNDTDCNDADPTVSPSGIEECDGIDQDCNGVIDDDPACTGNFVDNDGDGWGLADDCDDANPDIHPGATEVCDGVDQDCNGLIDDVPGGAALVYYPDLDADGFGDGAQVVVGSCGPPPGMAVLSGDCDDTDPLVHPAAVELCDGIDQDCDGVVDNGPLCFDLDGDGWSAPEDCDDTDPTIHPDADDVCDGIDQDCDGVIDDVQGGSGMMYFRDNDADGFGNPGMGMGWLCQPEQPGWVVDSSDCNDSDPSVHPDAVEVCDGIDQDCDGLVDDDLECEPEEIDHDGDGWIVGEDCDDTDASIHPDADEICDGIDQDCDGVVDDVMGGMGLLSFVDADGDGYGDPDTGEPFFCLPEDRVVDGSDCDDADAEINPSATEIPSDGIDQDCDGVDPESIVVGGAGCAVRTGAPHNVFRLLRRR